MNKEPIINAINNHLGAYKQEAQETLDMEDVDWGRLDQIVDIIKEFEDIMSRVLLAKNLKELLVLRELFPCLEKDLQLYGFNFVSLVDEQRLEFARKFKSHLKKPEEYIFNEKETYIFLVNSHSSNFEYIEVRPFESKSGEAECVYIPEELIKDFGL